MKVIYDALAVIGVMVIMVVIGALLGEWRRVAEESVALEDAYLAIEFCAENESHVVEIDRERAVCENRAAVRFEQ